MCTRVFVITVVRHTQTRFDLVGSIVSAQQPFYYNSKIRSFLACVQMGVLQLRQCVSSQPWACHGPLQGQIQPLQCAAGVVEPALGAVLGWAGGSWCCGFAGLCVAFPDEEAALANHSAQSPASV